LNGFIDFFIFFFYVQVKKPDAAIFRMALNGAQVQANEIVYIEDVEMFTQVATDEGISSIWHKDYLSTARALAGLGLTIK